MTEPCGRRPWEKCRPDHSRTESPDPHAEYSRFQYYNMYIVEQSLINCFSKELRRKEECEKLVFIHLEQKYGLCPFEGEITMCICNVVCQWNCNNYVEKARQCAMKCGYDFKHNFIPKKNFSKIKFHNLGICIFKMKLQT